MPGALPTGRSPERLHPFVESSLWRVFKGLCISQVVSRAFFISLDCFNVSLVAKLRAWLYVAVGVHCSRF